MRRNSITPSRAFLTVGVLVRTCGGSPFGPGRQSRTPQAQEATGFGAPLSSTRHMRQLPAIDSRSWKQKRGISAPAASQAWSSVYSGGTSTSMPSTMSLVIPVSLVRVDEVKAPLDPLKPRLHPVYPTLDAGKILFDPRHPNLQVAHVVAQTIDLLVDAPEIDQRDVFRL